MGMVTMAMGIATVWAGEKQIKADQLPAPVLAAANEACPDGTIKGIDKEKDDGVVAYEVEMMVGEMSCDLKIAVDGTILEKEQQMAKADLPKPVQATLSNFADIDVEKAELVKEMDKDAFYELDVEISEKAFELKISEKGKILEIESKGKKNEKEDEDEHENGDKD
jgi:hypothetical protein